MHLDARGPPLSTLSANAAAAYNHLVTGYLTQRADTPARTTALLEVDPDFALAHCMQGYFAMMAYSRRPFRSLSKRHAPRSRSQPAALRASGPTSPP
jgi:hypothetical protein